MGQKSIINVASWNIWIHGSRDYKEMAGLIRENSIDIIGIQETGIYYDQKPPLNIAEKIAEKLNFNFVFYPSLDVRSDPKRRYIIGNAILSRFPILESTFYPLGPEIEYDGTSRTEPRILVYAKIKLGRKALHFFTTHLQFSVKCKTTKIRLDQAEKIFSLSKKVQPAILAGDFNIPPQNEEIKKIEKVLTRVPGEEPTWSVFPWEKFGWKIDGLEYRTDHLFISKDLGYKNPQVIKSRLSDHLPIKVSVII